MPDPVPADAPSSPYDARPWLAHYPPGVPADFAFPEVPLTRLLDDAAASFPARTALAFLGRTLRGPQVFQGWWGGDDRPSTDDGWLLTGDLVVMDADGFFTVVDRKAGPGRAEDATPRRALGST